MAKNLVDVNTYPANVTVPEDGDARNALSVETPFQQLANRTHALNLSKAALAGAAFTGSISAPAINYTAPVALQKAIPIFLGKQNTGTSNLVEVANGFAWQFSTNNASAIWPVMLPNGSTITSVTANVNHGNAGASGQMSMELWGMLDNGSGGSDTQIGSTRTFAAGAGHKTESITPASGNVVNNLLTQYYVWINASALAATNDDYLYALRVNYTVPAVVFN